MLKQVVNNSALPCLFCFMLPLLSGCTLVGNNEAIQCCVPAEWDGVKASKDFPLGFPTDSVIETDRDLDIAIIGEGFFVLSDMSSGELIYTRLGHLNVNANGILIQGGSWVGRPLEPAIIIPKGTQKIQISDDGMVWVLGADVRRLENIGQIELATFAHPDGLRQVGENLYRETEASGRATIHTPGIDGTGVLKSQYLEKPKQP